MNGAAAVERLNAVEAVPDGLLSSSRDYNTNRLLRSTVKGYLATVFNNNVVYYTVYENEYMVPKCVVCSDSCMDFGNIYMAVYDATSP